MTTFGKLSEYGNVFQTKIIGALLTSKEFLLNISDSLDSEYFENSSHKWTVNYIIVYFEKYHTIPTVETLAIEIKKIENDILKIALTESVREAYRLAEASDLEYVENEFLSFCKNQQIKKAINTSVDLLNIADYDGIRSIITQALKVGENKDVGHIYDLDIESRYREDDRNAIPFPWPVFNNLTQGGYGKGDLVLIFGNPKGGKSWAVAAMGAHAAQHGYNVLHYSLELSEGYMGKRYDAILTGIPVDQLNDHKKEVEEAAKQLKGKIVIKSYPPRQASFNTIETHIEQLKHQNDFIPQLIIIDYLDYVRTKSRVDRKTEIDDVYVQAKALGARLGIPIVSPSQANRTGAEQGILESQHAAGSYDKIMIADILISLARGRKDRLNGTGNWHIMGNRYGADGLTFGSKIDTSNGQISINNQPLDEEDEKPANKHDYSGISDEDREALKQKFFRVKNEILEEKALF